ncbi:MAG: hypothetical protein VR65_12160 [Desulfobulbaceae bacterium BRH_c16a]|nr:MAG: hypothetical protein VR65_12160 [Desulfobulbaceae bacterium BRH_c16a]
MGWSYSQEVDEARKNNLFSVDEVTSDTRNFKKLATDRLDCLVAIELAGEMIIQQLNLQNVVEPAEKPIALNDTYVVFAKSLNHSELLSTFNTTLADMKKDGSYDKVVADFIAGN